MTKKCILLLKPDFCLFQMLRNELLLKCAFALVATMASTASYGQNTPGGHGYAGQQNDALTALINNRARYYDAETGTFISKDPLGVSGSLNGYQYCKSDPVNLTDPAGLFNQALFWPSLGGSIVNGIGFAIAGTADATGIGAIVGAPAGVYTGYQFGANVGNLVNSFRTGGNAVGPTGPVQALGQVGLLALNATPNSPLKKSYI